MKIKILTYDQTEYIEDVLSFEYRCNHVTSWIKLKYADNSIKTIYDVCVIKLVT